jgi:AmmeMemoRadiSam system radical SAM enzyme/AmmeMemoRadiSam system protein B/AmmeMemoRadiSam system protein A
MSRKVVLPPHEPAPSNGIRAAGWWHEEQDRLVCDLCPRACSLGPGDRGFCFVRQNLDGRMVSTTYGRSTGFCIDPIEKKPLAHFYPGTSVLSFGTAGCNLGCKFCQNWESSKSREVDAACAAADPEAVAEAAAEHGCRSVAFTYNDPIVWAEYAIDTARACHARDVKTVAVTSGYITPAARTAFYEHIDAANVDLKSFSEEFYWRLCSGHLEPVLDTLRWLKRETPVWLEITTLVIPQANDSADELRRMCDWIATELGPDVPLHFSAFHPDFRMLDRPRTPLATLLAAHKIATEAGLHYVYVGNVSNSGHEATLCPGCHRPVIERGGYALSSYALRGGACAACGTKIAGHFDDRPGDWGSRRQPIQVSAHAKQPVFVPAQPQPPAATPSPPSDSPDRPALTAEQERRIFEAAGLRVAAAVHGRSGPRLAEVLADAAGTPVYGSFVSLKRAGQLRSCCGFLGQTVPLEEALNHAAFRAATDDPRFPPISSSELAHLDMEVWLLWGLVPMTAKGEDRVAAVEIGRHGLQIARGGNRGLLLPGVAVEHKFDARRFLEQVCLKAGLPANAWKHDDTRLWTFEGYAIRGRLADTLPSAAAADTTRPSPEELKTLTEFCRRNLKALCMGATPSFYMPGAYDGGACGLALQVGLPNTAELVQSSMMGLRADKPLQSTLYTLVEGLAGALRKRRVEPRLLDSSSLQLSVFSDPAMHGTVGEPDLGGMDPRRRALIVIDRTRTAWVYDPQRTAEELLAEALRMGQFRDTSQAALFSVAVASNAPRVAGAYLPRPESGPDVRPAAVAGMFYPGTAAEIEQALAQMFSTDGPAREPWAAAMVPHAGWVYSGRLAAATLSRVQIPQQVIVLCPKHRPGGAEWAVAPHQTWSLPGLQVASDPELARQLAQGVTGLELDAVAHRQEHAIEVQLPLIARLAPQARVVGISIGGGEWPALLHFSAQLAQVLASLPERPLLVISTDMNHYAGQAETEELDRHALDAIEALDPRRLYQTVTEERISMCGLLPAVIVMETLRHLGALSECKLVGYTTSAEASGDRSRVVGYAGVLFR